MYLSLQDHTTLKLHQHADGGGVPSLWHQLVSSVSSERIASFTEQHSTVGAGMFGIGVLAPSLRSDSAEPDYPSHFREWGYGEGAWRSLCHAAPRLCKTTEKVPLLTQLEHVRFGR